MTHPKPTADADQPLRLLELRASNFAALRAVAIRPAGDGLVQITGKNDVGKSTILKAIKAAMVGRGGAPMRALRDGSEEGFLEADCGRLRVRRTITRRGEDEEWTLRVTLDGRAVHKRPQDVINGFLGALSFDPLAFARMGGTAEGRRKQYDLVRELVARQTGFDFDTHDAGTETRKEQRTEVGRERDRERGAAEAIALPPGPKPAAVVVAAKLDELKAANQRNAEIDAAIKQHRDMAREIDGKLEEAEALRARAATLEAQVATLEAKLDDLPTVPDKVDVAPIEAAIASADQANRVRALHEQRDRHEAAQDAKAAEYDKLTKQIAERDAARRAAIEGARLPVDGLGLGEGAVTYDGLPFDQAATSAKIRTSALLAMALNPTLRVVLVDEGSELDRESLAGLGAMARERGYDVWVTRVDETGEVGFVIEDGEVVRTEKDR